jgi:hypothetical protein
MKAYTTELINKIEADYYQGIYAKDKIYYRNMQGVRNSGLLFSFSPNEIIEWTKCHNDIIYFAEKYCKIRDTSDGSIHDIVLRDYQKNIINNSLTNKFNINACSRQVGMTTVIAIIALHQSIFKTEHISLLLHFKRCNGIELLDKIKDFYISLPFFLKPGVQTWDSTCIKFENMSRIKVDTGKNPAIGFSPDYTFVNDYAHIPPSLNVLPSLYPVIASRKNDKLMVSSSPNGINHFYELLTNAERKEGDPKKNVFVPNRVYWWEVPGRDEEWKKKEILMLGSEDLFNQEYDLQFFKR